MSDSSIDALASSDEEIKETQDLKLPELGRRTSSGPRRTYMVPESDESYQAIDTVKPIHNLSKRGCNVFVRFRPDNAQEIREGGNCITHNPNQRNV